MKVASPRQKTRARFAALAGAVFLLVICFNLLAWPGAREAYYTFTPHYGRGVATYGEMWWRKAGDRSWLLYPIVDRKFAGWRLVSFAQEPAWFSRMYNFNFGGFSEVRIQSYDFVITDSEAAALLGNPHEKVRLARLGGDFVVVFPDPGETAAIAVILRHGDTVHAREPGRFQGETHYLTPLSKAPPHLKGLK